MILKVAILVGLLLIPVRLLAGEGGDGSVVVRGKIVPEAELKKVYEDIRQKYVFTGRHRPPARIGYKSSFNVKATFKQSLGGSRMLMVVKGLPTVVVIRNRAVIEPGTKMEMALKPHPSPNYSYSMDNKPIRIPQYQDVTITYRDFIGYLKKGYHFPEGGDLTKAGMLRGFSKGRRRKMKVRDKLPEGSPSRF